MPLTPNVTVVLPAYGMGRYIAAALDSIAAQTYTDWEVVVVDDLGPEDGTHAIVEAFIARVGANKARLVRHAVNQGVSAARNTGTAEARGEYVAFLDPDDDWFPDHLASMMALFQSDPGVDVATGPVEGFTEDPSAPNQWVQDINAWHVADFPRTLALHNFIQPSATLLRRSAVQRVGGFDTDPAIQHIEDYDLWIRLVEQGSRFAFLDRPTSRYRRHDAAASNDAQRMHRLHDLLYAKHEDFFRTTRAKLMMIMLGRMGQMRHELTQANIELNGPVMSVVRAVDRSIRSVGRKVRGGK
ncbi:MAG TPA: glycosyltransferase [Flavobacteriales bacterium]|nr:glycosyltransferase [Flavobacteriales bacterium]